MGVAATHPDYDKAAKKWKRVRDVVAGQDAMHTAAEAYLPKLKAEDRVEYEARVKRSDFFNGTWRTIDALSGMAFRKPPTVKVPAGIESYLGDINMAGLPMIGLAREALEEILSPGRIGLLVDFPPRPDNVVTITVEAAERLGLRPTIQLYEAECIRNWKYSRIGNAWVLSQVVLGESEPIAKDEFEEKKEPRYRVLDFAPYKTKDGSVMAYRQRLFKVNDKGEDEQIGADRFPLMNGQPLDRIPFRIVGAGGLADAIDEPPLIDLVDKNVAHYQVNSDYRHGAHFTALPTLFLSGIDADESGAAPKILIGGSAAITSPHPEAKGQYIEFQGQGLGSLEKMLDRLEKQMALLGARMIADESTQAETLGATQIKRAGENSVLAKIVQSVSDALEWALTVFAEWAGQKGEITYQINRDFLPAGMDPQMITALVGAVQAGKFPERAWFDLAQRHDLIDPEMSFEEYQRAQDEEAPKPARPTMPANDGSNGGAAA